MDDSDDGRKPITLELPTPHDENVPPTESHPAPHLLSEASTSCNRDSAVSEPGPPTAEKPSDAGGSAALSRRASPLSRDLLNTVGASSDEGTPAGTLLHPSKSITDALRRAIAARRQYDHQMREQRVNPILIANLSIAPEPSYRARAADADVVREMVQSVAETEGHHEIRPVLAERFAERHATLSEKA